MMKTTMSSYWELSGDLLTDVILERKHVEDDVQNADHLESVHAASRHRHGMASSRIDNARSE